MVELPAYTAHDGEVYRGEVSYHPAQCRRLLDGYLTDARQDDWWAPIARTRAAELQQAMRQAGILEHHRSAA